MTLFTGEQYPSCQESVRGDIVTKKKRTTRTSISDGKSGLSGMILPPGAVRGQNGLLRSIYRPPPSGGDGTAAGTARTAGAGATE